MTLTQTQIGRLVEADRIYSAENLAEVIEVDTPQSITAYIPQTQPLLITRVERLDAWQPNGAPSEMARDLVGQVRMVGGTGSSHRGWMMADPAIPSANLRVFGAPVSPEPINGHHYRIIGGFHYGQLLRYNDADHVDDRGRTTLPWTIVQTTWGVENPMIDGYSNGPDLGSPYIEVRFGTPESDDLPPFGETTVGIPTDITIENLPRFRDQAVVVDGRVALDPELVAGETYLAYDPDGHRTYTCVADHNRNLQCFGYIDRYGDYIQDYYQSVAIGTPGWHHVKMVHEPVVVAPDLQPTRERVLEVKRQVREERVQFRNFTVALNELAREMDWCGEYEETVRRIGILGPDAGRRTPVPEVPELDANGDFLPEEPVQRILKFAWDFTVRVDADFEIDSPSGYVDDRIGNDLGITVSTSNLRFSSSTTVSLPTIEVEVDVTEVTDRGEDAARDMIDSSMISDALDDSISNGSVEEITDWSVEDSTDVTDEQDWYDEDDYEDLD